MAVGSKVYMTGSTDPWYVKPSDPGSPDAAMNTDFGVGNWTKYSGYTSAAISSSVGFLYIDGGYQTSTAFDAFITANVGALQTYVAAGGVLVLNASRYDTAAQSLGFGVTLNHGYSPNATAIVASNPVFQGPNGATGTSFTGGYFANDYLTATPASGFQPLINGTAGVVLGTEKYGTGLVVFGSMSDPKYDLPLAQAETLRANILSYANTAFVPTLNAAVPGTVEINQTTVVGVVTAFQPVDTLVLAQTAGTGALSLSSNGDGTYNVIYTAPGTIPTSVVDGLSYTVTDTSHTATPNVLTANVSVQLDRGPVVSPGVVAPGTVEASQSLQIGTVSLGLPGDALAVVSSAAAKGTVSLSPPAAGSETVIYTAPAVVTASGPDSFTYTVSDQHHDVAPVTAATVQLDVGPKIVQAPKNAALQTGTIEAGQTLTLGTVTAGFASDALAVTYSATGGVVTLVPTATAGVDTVVYTAGAAHQNLADQVSYTVRDQYLDIAASATTIVQQDKGPTIGPAASFVVGHGRNYVIGFADIAATSGLSGDTLKFAAGTATPGSETTDGTKVTYTASNATVPTAAAFSYTVSDQYNDVTQTGTASGTIDPGPAALDLTGAVTVGRSVVLGTVTPGLSLDNLALSTTGNKGHLSLAADGTVTYAADGGLAYGTIPSLSYVTDSFTYTVTDQWGDTITKNVSVKVNNIVNYITGPTYGGPLPVVYGGTVGDNVVTLTGFNNKLVTYDGSDVVTGGDGQTTILKGQGDLTSHLRGYNNTITAGNGNHSIDGSVGQLTVSLGSGNNTIAFDGFNNVINVTGPGNNTVYQVLAGGNNLITLGAGTQTVVVGGSSNTITTGNNSTSAFSFINAGPSGVETVTAGDGNNYILAGGYNDKITVGNGFDVIFATGTSGALDNPPGTPAAVPHTGVINAGLATVTLGNTLGVGSDNFVFLGGSSNTVFLGSSTLGHFNTIHGGTGLDNYIVAANGGDTIINNFQMAGGDKIDVSKFLSSTEFANISTTAVFSAGVSPGEQIVTLTGGAGRATLDLFGVGGSSHAQILSHFSFGH